MKDMKYRVVFVWICCFLLLLFFQSSGMAQRRSKQKQPAPVMQITAGEQAYNRLFRGKKVDSSKGGLMTIHAVRERGKEKVYVEFPCRLLGREFMFTTGIHEISDVGEGIVGQLNNYLYLNFSRRDSALLIRLKREPLLLNDSEEENIGGALQAANTPGVWQTLKILAYTPDSSAVVVDMTKLFMDHTEYTSPFDAGGSNAFGGYNQRNYRLQADMSKLKTVKSRTDQIVVTADFHYFTDYNMLGAVNIQRNRPIDVLADRILWLLPETPMRPRYADSRIGTMMLAMNGIDDAGQGFVRKNYAMRWRLEPSDTAAYRAGTLVAPRKPIVFYMDTLIPADWQKAVKDGMEAWNEAFEAIGFKDVIQVKAYPRDDPSFDPMDVRHCMIWYSVLWKGYAKHTVLADIRSGEILNTPIVMNCELMKTLEFTYKRAAIASDARARTNGAFPSELRYELMKAYMTQLAGKCLGLSSNYKVGGAFPLDSLRSATFTQKYGVTPSIMHYLEYNYIAEEKDVEKGVRLIPKGPGEYDRYAIKWLYAPVFEAKTAEEELPVLDSWITAEKGNPNCAYAPANRLMYDPSVISGLISDDHYTAMKQFMKNTRYALKHIKSWCADGDPDYKKRMELSLAMVQNIFTYARMLVSHIGGMVIDYGSDGITLDIATRAEQKKYTDLMLSWLTDKKEFGLGQILRNPDLANDPSSLLMGRIFGEIFGRIEYMFFLAEKSKDTYTAEEFFDYLSAWVWAPTRQGRSLTAEQKSMQDVMVAALLSSCGLQTETVQAMGMQGAQPSALTYSSVPDGIDFPAYRDEVEEHELDREQAIFIEFPGDIRVSRTPVQHFYYKKLLDTKKMLQEVTPRSSGDTRMHYEYLLYRIGQVLQD